MRCHAILALSSLIMGFATAQSSDYDLPANNIARGKVADLLSSPNVVLQWRYGGIESKYAWDGATGCYSETWTNQSDVVSMQSYCKGNLTIYGTNKKCTSTKSTITA